MPKPAAGIIQFAGTCEACCTCDDYVSILDELHRLVDQFSRIKDLLDEAREQYQTGVTTFNDRVLHQERFKATLTVGRDNATDNTRVRFILTLTNRDTVPCSVYGLTVAYEIPDGTCETVQDSLSFACRVPTDEPGEFMAVTGRDMDMASVATGWWAPYVWDGTRQLRSITAGNSIAITWEARVEHCVPHDAATWPLTGTVEVVVAFTATPPTGGVMVTKTIGYTCT
jgi:hypothetical protein